MSIKMTKGDLQSLFEDAARDLLDIYTVEDDGSLGRDYVITESFLEYDLSEAFEDVSGDIADQLADYLYYQGMSHGEAAEEAEWAVFNESFIEVHLSEFIEALKIAAEKANIAFFDTKEDHQRALGVI